MPSSSKGVRVHLADAHGAEYARNNEEMTLEQAKEIHRMIHRENPNAERRGKHFTAEGGIVDVLDRKNPHDHVHGFLGEREDVNKA